PARARCDKGAQKGTRAAAVLINRVGSGAGYIKVAVRSEREAEGTGKPSRASRHEGTYQLAVRCVADYAAGPGGSDVYIAVRPDNQILRRAKAAASRGDERACVSDLVDAGIGDGDRRGHRPVFQCLQAKPLSPCFLRI